MKLLSEIRRQLNPTTLSLFGCAVLAGPILAVLLDNEAYYWDMAYCLSFLIAALIYTSGQRVTARDNDGEQSGVTKESGLISTKWIGYIVSFAVVLAGSIFFSYSFSTIATKMTYLGAGVILPVALFWSANWLRKKLARPQL